MDLRREDNSVEDLMDTRSETSIVRQMTQVDTTSTPNGRNTKDSNTRIKLLLRRIVGLTTEISAVAEISEAALQDLITEIEDSLQATIMAKIEEIVEVITQSLREDSLNAVATADSFTERINIKRTTHNLNLSR